MKNAKKKVSGKSEKREAGEDKLRRPELLRKLKKVKNGDVVEVPISLIEVGERVRKDIGDLEELKASVEEQGLFSYPSITREAKLVAGERRLETYKLLGRTTIQCVVKNLSNEASRLKGELEENIQRRNLKLSEMAQAADRYKAELGRRQGRPSKKVSTRAQFRGQKTRDIVAKTVGFSSAAQLERVKKVVERGVSELIVQMDEGKIKVSLAAELTELEEEDITTILAIKENEDREAAIKEAISRKKKNPSKDKTPDPQLKTGHSTDTGTDEEGPVSFAVETSSQTELLKESDPTRQAIEPEAVQQPISAEEQEATAPTDPTTSEAEKQGTEDLQTPEPPKKKRAGKEGKAKKKTKSTSEKVASQSNILTVEEIKDGLNRLTSEELTRLIESFLTCVYELVEDWGIAREEIQNFLAKHKDKEESR